MAEKEDAPLIDLNEASIKKLISKAKKRGYVTYDELNEALPSGEMSPDQIEDIQTALSEMGVQIVESDEDAEAEAEDREDGESDDDGVHGGVLPRKVADPLQMERVSW